MHPAWRATWLWFDYRGQVPRNRPRLRAVRFPRTSVAPGPTVAALHISIRSRLFSAFKPFQLLMAIALLAGGFNYLSVETFGVGTDREIIPQDGRGREFHLADVERRMPKARMIPYAGLAVLAGVAITGTLLASVGYQAVITALAALGGACALWTFARFAFPQVTISVVPGGK